MRFHNDSDPAAFVVGLRSDLRDEFDVYKQQRDEIRVPRDEKVISNFLRKINLNAKN